MNEHKPLQDNVYLEFTVDTLPGTRKEIIDQLTKNIGSKIPKGVSVVPVVAGQMVELKIAYDSGDTYELRQQVAETIGSSIGSVAASSLGLIPIVGSYLAVVASPFVSDLGGEIAKEFAEWVMGSRDEYLQNQVDTLEDSLTHTEARIEEVELEMSRLTRGADDDSFVTEQGELDRLRQEYVDLQHQRDALNDQIVHARTVLSADETFDYDADYGSTEAPTGEADLDDLEFRDWLEENHPDLSRHIDADGNLRSDPTAGNATDQGDAGVTRLAELNRELEAAREEYQEYLNPSDNDAANADGYILPTAEEAQQADNHGGGFSAVVKMYLKAA